MFALCVFLFYAFVESPMQSRGQIFGRLLWTSWSRSYTVHAGNQQTNEARCSFDYPFMGFRSTALTLHPPIFRSTELNHFSFMGFRTSDRLEAVSGKPWIRRNLGARLANYLTFGVVKCGRVRCNDCGLHPDPSLVASAQDASAVCCPQRPATFARQFCLS